MVSLRLHLCAATAFALTACSVTPPGEINEIYREVIEQRQTHYKIKPGDLLSVRFYSEEHARLEQEQATVLPDGRTDFLFMHDFKVAGLTVSELEAALREKVAKEVVQPEIAVQVAPRGEKVYMVGEFERPQFIELDTQMTLHEAISAVGGMRVTGDTDYALLRRPFMNPRHPDLFRIDLNDESEELFLLPSDQIVLGRNAMGTVVHYFQVFITSMFPGSNWMWYAFGGY